MTREEKLEKALRAIQWGNSFYIEGQLVTSMCPMCDQVEANGHATDCWVGMALNE